MSTKRIAQLKQMLAGRTDRDGNALKGYAKNVVAIRAELNRLGNMVQHQTALTITPASQADPKQSAESFGGVDTPAATP